jgi:hypothetical protein
MLTLEAQTIDRLEKVRASPWAPQGPCAALTWALTLYLIEGYHPTIGLDYTPAGRAAPGLADWHGVRIRADDGLDGDDAAEPAGPAGPGGLIRFWDAAVFDERPGGNGWLDLGRRLLQGELGSAGALAELCRHLGLPERADLPVKARTPRWIFYLTLLRAGVDLIVDGHGIILSRGLDWAEHLAGPDREPHPLVQTQVLGVNNSGASEWLVLTGYGATLFVHRRDARLIDWQSGWRITPAAGWLPDASWRIGQYLAERLQRT